MPIAPSPITTHAQAGTLLPPDEPFVDGALVTTTLLVVVLGSGAVTVRSAPVWVLVTVEVVGGSVTVVESVLVIVVSAPVVVAVPLAAAETPVAAPKATAANASTTLRIDRVSRGAETAPHPHRVMRRLRGPRR